MLLMLSWSSERNTLWSPSKPLAAFRHSVVEGTGSNFRVLSADKHKVNLIFDTTGWTMCTYTVFLKTGTQLRIQPRPMIGDGQLTCAPPPVHNPSQYLTFWQQPYPRSSSLCGEYLSPTLDLPAYVWRISEFCENNVTTESWVPGNTQYGCSDRQGIQCCYAKNALQR